VEQEAPGKPFLLSNIAGREDCGDRILSQEPTTPQISRAFQPTFLIFFTKLEGKDSAADLGGVCGSRSLDFNEIIARQTAQGRSVRSCVIRLTRLNRDSRY
jgi:hypothetical protein